MVKIAVVRGFKKGSKVLRGRDGHLYHFNRTMDGGRLSFRCCSYYKLKCKGRCSIEPSGRGFLSNRRHNHVASEGAILLRKFRHVVLQRCRSKTTDSFKKIYHDERRRLKIPKRVAAFLTLTKLRPSMRLAKSKRYPKTPATISELAKLLASKKWKHLTKTLDKKDSILAAAGGQHEDRTQFIIFTSRRLVKYLKRVEKIFCDGTFCTPAKMAVSQIWNLVTVRRNHTLCLARVLMQSRKTKCYVRVLKALKRLQRSFKPITVMADFEKGQQKGWAKVFPNCRRRGCFFHYKKNVVKKAKKSRLTKLIKENKAVNLIVGMLCALPLLPDDRIGTGFKIVAKRAERKGHYDKLEPLLSYVLTNWVQGNNREILSVYRCPDRTSNVCESDNAGLNALFNSKHPAVWTLLGAFLESEDITHQDLVTLDRGRNPTAARRSSALANDEMLQALWKDLDEGTMSVGKFLHQASYSVKGVLHKEFFGKKKKNAE